MVVTITEPLTGVAEVKIPVAISLRALFSKFSIQPARGLNFGPIQSGTSAAGKSIEIANLGEFPFTVRLFDVAVGLVSEAHTCVALSLSNVWLCLHVCASVEWIMPDTESARGSRKTVAEVCVCVCVCV